MAWSRTISLVHYSTLEISSSHLNDHVRLQKHGNKREPHGEFPNPPMPVETRESITLK